MIQEQINPTWKVDPGHSSLQFKVKHMAIANILGVFNVFDGMVISEDDEFTNAEVTLMIDVNSIDTNNKMRDEHLCGDMFFNSNQFPTISFKGRLNKAVVDYILIGDLIIRDVATKVTLQAKLTGRGLGRWGDSRAGFEITGEVNRKECGLNFNVLTEAGSVIVGDVVKLHLDVELIRA